MDLLNQVKPLVEAKKISTVVTTAPKVVKAPEEILQTLEPKKVTVTSLDSGEIEEFNTSPTPDNTSTQETQEAHNIYQIQTFCNRYLMYHKEFTSLSNMSQRHLTKFSSEIELITSRAKDATNEELLKYLDSKYGYISFEFDIDVQREMQIESITIKDKIHFEGDTVIVPLSYDGIIDSILGMIVHTYRRIQFIDSAISRDIRVANPLKILFTNQQYCSTCKFFSVCDYKLIKEG